MKNEAQIQNATRIVSLTKAFQKANNPAILSPYNILMFVDAIESKNQGVDVDFYLSKTCFGLVGKAIVREIFQD